ncbi:hypothetical protein BSKO_00155 [Bryopsis sp. KO-2023]|nr:hypothetical protein BSKO_00155 [Bryopsis sp. KO-2023]
MLGCVFLSGLEPQSKPEEFPTNRRGPFPSRDNFHNRHRILIIRSFPVTLRLAPEPPETVAAKDAHESKSRRGFFRDSNNPPIHVNMAFQFACGLLLLSALCGAVPSSSSQFPSVFCLLSLLICHFLVFSNIGCVPKVTLNWIRGMNDTFFLVAKVPQADTSCLAFSNLQIVSINARCSGKAVASCEEVVAGKQALGEVLETWIEAGICEKEARENASKNVAATVGSIWSSTFATVDCEGESFGCGWAVSAASTKTWGKSLAQSLLDALKGASEAGKGGEDIETDLCETDVLKVEGVLGNFAEDAIVKICVEGGEKSDFEELYVGLAAADISIALENAVASICGGTEGTSTCLANAPQSEWLDESLDDLVAGEESIEPCVDQYIVSRCCTEAAKGRGYCVCTRCANPLKNEEIMRVDSVAWRDANGERCYC